MGKPKEGGISAVWESSDVMIFCDICIVEIELGNRPTSHLNKEGWNNLVSKFFEKTGKKYDKLQMKNKWDHLKKEWRLWQELKRGETGLGWNASKKTIEASDEWWDERIKVLPSAKKFRYAGIHPDLEEKLNVMFSTVVATGNNACSSFSRNQTVESVDERFTTNTPNAEVDINEDVLTGDVGGSSLGSKRLKKGKKNLSNSLLEELVESSKNIASNMNNPIKSCGAGRMNREEYSSKYCIRSLFLVF